MAEPTTPTDTVRGFSRRVAQRQLATVERYDEAVQRYAQSLRRYADEEIDGAELGKDVLNLTVEQAARNVEDAIELGAEYSRWVWSLTGVQVREDPEKSQPERKKAPAKKASQSRSA